MNNTTTLECDALYPREGVARITRQYCSLAPEWPSVNVGDKIRVLDNQGWLWDAEVTEVRDPKHLVANVSNKTASPMPVPEDGAVSLPNMSGHAHCRDWRTGDVIQLHGSYYKVKGKPKPNYSHSRITYTLTAVDEKAWATRPGRVRMSSESEARKAVGSAIQAPSGEWLHVSEVKYRKYGSAEGEVFGTTWLCFGKYVPEAKAAKINETNPHLVSAALHNAKSIRHQGPMPEDAVVLVPRNHTSLAASGERVAIVGKTVLHERVGDPDMSDSWYHYVVAIDDKDLLARVKKTIAKLNSAKK